MSEKQTSLPTDRQYTTTTAQSHARAEALIAKGHARAEALIAKGESRITKASSLREELSKESEARRKRDDQTLREMSEEAAKRAKSTSEKSIGSIAMSTSGAAEVLSRSAQIRQRVMGSAGEEKQKTLGSHEPEHIEGVIDAIITARDIDPDTTDREIYLTMRKRIEVENVDPSDVQTAQIAYELLDNGLGKQTRYPF